ncbi:2,3-dimethylmalate dehydratase large subunit [bacterium BMS3Abin05]|nr:2,3-dimethylmalate dehydratase large subunit [bacterium BMS3Abin05]
MSQTLIEKIAGRFAVGLDKDTLVHSGDFLSIRPAYVMTHDNTGAVIPKFHAIGAKKLADPRQVVFALDHNIQDKSEKNRRKYAKIEAFAEEMGSDFYPAGRGIGHQIMVEEGYAWPGTLVVASDSHSNMYGGLGCLGTPVVRTDAAAIWATGRTWWQVPPVAKVVLTGSLRPGVSGKDVILTLAGLFNHDEVLNHAIEFAGEGVGNLAIDQRLTIANMTTEWGALAGVFPIDATTIRWLRARAAFVAERGPEGVASDADWKDAHPRICETRIQALEAQPVSADKDAFYAKELVLDLHSVQPHVSGPDTVKIAAPIMEIRRKAVAIDRAYVVSCVNSRVSDLAEAAAVVKGRRISPRVEFYIAAASRDVQAESDRRGDWQTLLNAGATPLPPGCGPCIGLGEGLLKDGEVGISATNRNYKGRMGSPKAHAYLASPAVVAASAIAGKIDYPGDFDDLKPEASIIDHERPGHAAREIAILPGFPDVIEGELVFCPQDNLNTDGIYPGKYTYIDDFTPEQQAGVVMENYDPQFRTLVKKGDILVGGFNFGTGSSREQAATALKYGGIKLVLAGSFSETYKRNAINNGFLVLEAPGLVTDLKKQFGTEALTIRTGIRARLDFKKALLTAAGKEYAFGPVGTAAQELIVAGGLGKWVEKQL